MASPYGQGAVGPSTVSAWPAGLSRRPRPAEARSRFDRSAIARRLAMADLVEGLAHDLKNQLTVVAASVQLARGTAGETSAADLLDRAFLAAMRAAGLLDEMLSYTRSGATPRQAEADVGEALETAVAGAWSYCGARCVDVEMCAALGLPLVCAPPAALRVLFWRLLCYMADTVRPGVRLLVGAEPVDGSVALRVRVRPPERSTAGTAPVAPLVSLAQEVPALPWPAGSREGGAEEAGTVGAAHGATAESRAAYGYWDGTGGEPEEQAVILALASQAGAELRWEADGPALFLAPVPVVGRD